MLLSVFCILMGATVAVQGMTETCTSVGVSYTGGTQFRSIKNGRLFLCRCLGDSCIRMVCSRTNTVIPQTTSPPTTSSVATNASESSGTGGDSISGSPVGHHPGSTKPIFIPSGGGGRHSIRPIRPIDGRVCLHAGRRFQIGREFDKVRPRKRCRCILENGVPTIKCRTAGCDLPPAPEVAPGSIGNTGGFGGCYDAWNRQSYADGATYTRTRKMTHDGSIMGEYSCRCTRNFMRCSAVDIPCCDTSTGEFAAAGSRFVTMHNNQELQCTCMGGRGRYQNCVTTALGSVGGDADSQSAYPLRYPTTSGSAGGGGRSQSVYPVRYSRPSVTKCTDRYTGMQYSAGQQFPQDRGDAIWSCTCHVTPTRYRVICNFLRSKE